jgi:hypothetical protein
MKTSLFLEKIQRRMAKAIKNTVSFNVRFRPAGIYQTSKAFADSVKHKKIFYREIYPNLVTKLPISEELHQACSDYFKPNLIVETTYLVIEVPHGRVHTDNAISIAVITEDNKLIADVSFSYNYGRTVDAEENNIFKQRFFTWPKRYKGTVFTMLTGGSGIDNYSHWLIDVLPRIHLLKKSGLFDQVAWFLVPAYKHDFQRQTLQLLGIGPEKIIEGDKHPHIEADRIIASSAPRGNDSLIPYWLCDFLRSAFLKEDLISTDYPPLIYLSRKDSKFRTVANEEALTEVLEKYGFHSFVLSDLSFKEKVSLFASAQVIISATGAGMTNIVFCQKGTKVIEIFNEGFVVGPFYDLAPKVGLFYSYLICKTGSKAKNLKQGQQEDIVVDIEAVQKELETMLITKDE